MAAHYTEVKKKRKAIREIAVCIDTVAITMQMSTVKAHLVKKAT